MGDGRGSVKNPVEESVSDKVAVDARAVQSRESQGAGMRAGEDPERARLGRILRVATIVIALSAVAALVVVRFDGVCAVLGVAWDAALPLVVGAVIAYLVNLVAAAWEHVWFPRSKNALVARTRRGVCVALAFLSVGVVVAAVVALMVSEFREVSAAVVSGVAEAGSALSTFIAQTPEFEELAANSADVWDKAAEAVLSAVGGASEAVRLVGHAGGEVVHVVLNALLGLVFALYLLLDKERVCAGARRLVALLPIERAREGVFHAANSSIC